MNDRSMRSRRSRSRAVGSRSHPIAEPARRRCRELHPVRAARVPVACAECWERAIRDDERVVVLFGLPRAIEPDPEYVDEIAVEQAVAGLRPSLTATEEAAAVAVLAERGWSDNRIGEWLGIRCPRVTTLRVGESTALPAGPEAA
ncbi:hypothetical protein ACU61A_23195 [Pseudonocardia sichuanensis]